MFAIRCTRKLLKRGAPSKLETPVAPTTVLGDWYANVLVTRPEHLVLCISERTLLPVVVTAKDVRRLSERVVSAAQQMLASIGLPQQDIDFELREIQTSYLATTLNRRVIGSLNDFMYHLESGTGSNRSQSLQDRAYRLASIPCAVLDYAYPREAAIAAFAASHAVKAAKSAA